jgi:hypothetical protein
MDERSPQEPPREVLSSLPNSRPQRRSARRDGAGRPAEAAGKAAKRPRAARATKSAADARRKAPSRGRAGADAGAAAAEGVAAASGRGAAPADERDLLIKGPRVGPRPPASAARRPRRAVRDAEPRPASPAATRSTAGRDGAAGRPRSVEPPGAAEILSAAVQSAGELAELGLKAGTQLLRSAVARLPKP